MKENDDTLPVYVYRLVLLGVSLFCAASSLVTIPLLIHFRKLKVFKFSSPTFLSLTLIGCCVMYRCMKKTEIIAANLDVVYTICTPAR